MKADNYEGLVYRLQKSVMKVEESSMKVRILCLIFKVRDLEREIIFLDGESLYFIYVCPGHLQSDC